MRSSHEPAGTVCYRLRILSHLMCLTLQASSALSSAFAYWSHHSGGLNVGLECGASNPENKAMYRNKSVCLLADLMPLLTDLLQLGLNQPPLFTVRSGC